MHGAWDRMEFSTSNNNNNHGLVSSNPEYLDRVNLFFYLLLCCARRLSAYSRW